MPVRATTDSSVLPSQPQQDKPALSFSEKQSLMNGRRIKHGQSTEKPLRIIPWATNCWAPLPALGGAGWGEGGDPELLGTLWWQELNKTLVEGGQAPVTAGRGLGSQQPNPSLLPCPYYLLVHPTSQPSWNPEAKGAHRYSLLGARTGWRSEDTHQGSSPTENEPLTMRMHLCTAFCKTYTCILRQSSP